MNATFFLSVHLLHMYFFALSRHLLFLVIPYSYFLCDSASFPQTKHTFFIYPIYSKLKTQDVNGIHCTYVVRLKTENTERRTCSTWLSSSILNFNEYSLNSPFLFAHIKLRIYISAFCTISVRTICMRVPCRMLHVSRLYTLNSTYMQHWFVPIKIMKIRKAINS